jgi:hypothetical protein
MPKLTAAQLTALAKIEDNPGRVEAITRVWKDWGRINGNVEHSLTKLGLIEKSQESREVTYFTHGREHTVDIRWWKLTSAGADALRETTFAAAG